MALTRFNEGCVGPEPRQHLGVAGVMVMGVVGVMVMHDLGTLCGAGAQAASGKARMGLEPLL